VVQHQVVSVGVREERHVADTGINGVPDERDALAFQFGSSGGDIIDVQREVTVLLGRKRHPDLGRFPDPETGLSSPELEARSRIRTQAKRVRVEAPESLCVLRWDRNEVKLGDH
jgi:hypothetical protein